MDIPPIRENLGGSLPPIEGQRAVTQAFGPKPGFSPVDSKTIISKLAEQTSVEVSPSYRLAGMAVIRAASAAQME